LGVGSQVAGLIDRRSVANAKDAWENVLMAVVDGYTQSVLVPQLQRLGLNQRQSAIVVDDVVQRLESLLSHWNDEFFRRTILVLGTEEGSFWEPRNASVEIRSLVLLAVRNSLIEDLGASHPYTKELRSARERLPDDRMPWITSEAIKYFQAADLDAVQPKSNRDVFGELPQRFPAAWHVLSLLGNSPRSEIVCDLPVAESQPMNSSSSGRQTQRHTVVTSGIDPRLDSQLLKMLRLVKERELDLFFSASFKSITRNPKKLLSIIDTVLRYGGTVLTPNYLLSPSYLARRDPLLRPIHNTFELEAQLKDATGLSERHRNSLALLAS
jgi:hypothetical protein